MLDALFTPLEINGKKLPQPYRRTGYGHELL